MKHPPNTVSLLVYGDKAMFADPVTKTGGERHSYSVPTYDALRGVLESCYWKPTIRWVIDRVRVMAPITKESVSLRLPKYTSNQADRSYNTYLTNVAYQVEAHIEWADIAGYEGDRNYIKHLTIAERSIARGGRFDVYLGGRECQAYVEPCEFGSGQSAYDHTPIVDFGLMYHGYTYPNMCGEPALYARFWNAVMKNGIITFPAPEECEIVRFVRCMPLETRPAYDPGREEEIPSEIHIPEDISTPPVLEQSHPAQPGGDQRSWAAKLCQTYDNLIAADLEGEEGSLGILYPGHIRKPAQFELTLDGDGNLIPGSIRLIPDDEADTVVPCSIHSQFRTITKLPHLLFDNLEYLAGDYPKYIDDDGSAHKRYMDQLHSWCSSEARHPFADIICTYLAKDTLMADLDQAGVLPIQLPKDEETPLGRWPKSAGTGMVRFKIQIDGLDPEIWNNRSLWESVCEFNRLQSAQEPQDVCYVTGEACYPATLHPYARGTTKLISSNDKTDFTYRYGIRDQAQDYLQIGYETSQKMHLALRWLLANQSFTVGSQTYILWSTHNMQIPKLLIPGPGIPEDEVSEDVDITGKEYAELVRRYVFGLTQKIPADDEVVLMTIATPTTGRISVTQYEIMTTGRFLDNLHRWYASTAARLPVKGGLELRAPAPYEVADVACGVTQVPAERERVIQSILSAMILGRPIPGDVIKSLASCVIKQCSTGESSAKTHPANFKPLNVTAGMIRKYLNDLSESGDDNCEEAWHIALDNENQDRSYLFGRLVAYYYRVENYAQHLSGNGFRTTNAERMMSSFYERPASVLKILSSRLIPYRTRLYKYVSGRSLLTEMDAFISTIPTDFICDESLTESFILGYHAQLNEFKFKNNKKTEEN